MTKNTDPRTLNQTNVGDAAVYTFKNGDSQSVVITRVLPERVSIEWKTSPTKSAGLWLVKKHWGRLTLFPAGCKFLAV